MLFFFKYLKRFLLIALFVVSGLASADSCELQGTQLPALAPSQGISVENTSELRQALRSAKGGETILLRSGEYGTLDIRKRFLEPITIRSADTSNPACFKQLRLRNASNIRLQGVVFDYEFLHGERKNINQFKIQSSRAIEVSHSLFDGDLARNTGSNADGRGFGLGLLVTDSQDIVVQNNEFRDWWVALMVLRTEQFTLADSELHSLRSDGLIAENVSQFMFRGNYIHDFKAAAGSGEHRDMLQIIRAKGVGSRDITIRDNVFDMGRGDFTQTIFAGASGQNLGRRVVRHKNILIENNIIYNAHLHGITIAGVDNISVRRNSLIRVSGGHSDPGINLASGSTSVVIEKNVTNRIAGYENQRDWILSNNVTIQNKRRGEQNHYDQLFVYYARADRDGYNLYGIKPGSLIDQQKAGSNIFAEHPTRR